MLQLILALLLLSPNLSARWDSDHSATIQWTQVGRACLYRDSALGEHIFIGCYDRVGTITLELGGPRTDAAYRPTAGDVYTLTMGGQVTHAPLRGRAVYLAVWRG